MRLVDPDATFSNRTPHLRSRTGSLWTDAGDEGAARLGFYSSALEALAGRRLRPVASTPGGLSSASRNPLPVAIPRDLPGTECEWRVRPTGNAGPSCCGELLREERLEPAVSPPSANRTSASKHAVRAEQATLA